MTLNATRALLLASAAMISTPAFAQSNAEEMANEIIALGEAQGAEIQIGAREISGDTLRLNDVTYAFDQNGVTAELVIPWLQFQETGAAVEMTFAPSMGGTIVSEKDGTNTELTITSSGLVYALSGSPEARAYDISGDQMNINVKLAGSTPELQDLDMNFTFKDMTGSALLEGGVTGTVDMDLNVASLLLNYVIDADETKANFVSDMTDLVMSYEGDQMTAESATQLFSGESGLAMVMSVGLNTFDGQLMPKNAPPFDIQGQAESGLFNVSLGNGGLNYDVSGANVNYKVSSPAMPIPPIDLTMSEYGMRFAMPIGKPGTTSDLGLLIKFQDLIVNEDLWAMIDPGKLLPRDPATLNIDVTGKATTKADFSNPEAMANLRGAPIDVHDVAINDVTLSIAGAELNAAGAATLDNSGMIPVPTGRRSRRRPGSFDL